MNEKNDVQVAHLESTHIDQSSAQAGVQLMARLIRERTQFSVAPDDTGWTISFITHTPPDSAVGAA
jgi:hypothetical protein